MTDTTTEAVQQRCLTLDNVMSDEALEELRAVLRALAQERDAMQRRLDVEAMANDELVEGVEKMKAERDALARERDAAQIEAYELRLTIMGGEDAPGFAGSIPLDEIKMLHLRNRQAQQSRAESAEAERDAARAEVERLKRGWLASIQTENSCPATGGGCLAKRCGCLAELEMLMREDDERAALAAKEGGQ